MSVRPMIFCTLIFLKTEIGVVWIKHRMFSKLCQSEETGILCFFVNVKLHKDAEVVNSAGQSLNLPSGPIHKKSPSFLFRERKMAAWEIVGFVSDIVSYNIHLSSSVCILQRIFCFNPDRISVSPLSPGSQDPFRRTSARQSCSLSWKQEAKLPVLK